MRPQSQENKERELKVIDLYNKGLSYGQIAKHLGLCPKADRSKIAGAIRTARRTKEHLITRTKEADTKNTRKGTYLQQITQSLRTKKLRSEPIPLPKVIEEPKSNGFTLIEISSSGCRWPISGQSDETKFCGIEGFPYCSFHKEKSIRKPTRKVSQRKRYTGRKNFGFI